MQRKLKLRNPEIGLEEIEANGDSYKIIKHQVLQLVEGISDRIRVYVPSAEEERAESGEGTRKP